MIEVKRMNDSKRSIPLWQMLTVVFVIVFISTIIVLSLFFEHEKWKITAEIVSCISFLLIICLSFFFDSIQIGKIGLLKNELKDKETQISNLQNFILKNQNTNIVSNNFSISTETNKDVEQEKEKIQEEEEKNLKIKKELRKKMLQNAEQKYITNFCHTKKIREEDLQKNVKIVESGTSDPISFYTPIFDYYYNCGFDSEFIVLKAVGSNFYLIKFQLYMMLSKLYLYNKFSSNNNKLKLVLLYESPKNNKEDYSKSIKQDFSPACNSGLLSVESLNIRESE